MAINKREKFVYHTKEKDICPICMEPIEVSIAHSSTVYVPEFDENEFPNNYDKQYQKEKRRDSERSIAAGHITGKVNQCSFCGRYCHKECWQKQRNKGKFHCGCKE